jgi:hypothetical protein
MKVSPKRTPLVAIAAMVPFESFRPKLHTAPIKGELRRSEAERRNSAGRKPWDEVVIFKALVLQALYGRAVVVKRFQANNSNFCRSRARASLRDQPLALPAWDQQEETEQSDSRTDRGRAIDTRAQSELVSSIVPRGTSLRWIVVLSLRQFGVRRSDCRRHFPCPAELGSITPHAMHNHGEPSCQCDDGFFLPPTLGNVHRPCL